MNEPASLPVRPLRLPPPGAARLGLLRLTAAALAALAVPLMTLDTSLFWPLVAALLAGSVSCWAAYACRRTEEGARASNAAAGVLGLLVLAYWELSLPRGPLRFPGEHYPLTGWMVEPAELHAWFAVTLAMAWTVGALVWSACAPNAPRALWATVLGALLALYVTFAAALGPGSAVHAAEADGLGFASCAALGSLAGMVVFLPALHGRGRWAEHARTVALAASVTGALLVLRGAALLPA